MEPGNRARHHSSSEIYSRPQEKYEVIGMEAIECSINVHTGYSAPNSQPYIMQDEKKAIEKPYREEIDVKRVHKGIHLREDGVLFTPIFLKQMLVMSLWFFCSFATIVINKYILSTLDGDPGVLGGCQILMTTFFGSIMMYLPVCKAIKRRSKPNDSFNRYQFYITISLLGWLRFGAIACSVIGLKYVAVSFSETIKSSAPLFTAIIAYFILGEYSGIYVNMSLLPIMFGLAISTSTELSFNMTGFLAAITNNLLDCIQNVFSKKLLSGDEPRFSPLELQFYTSVAATVVQMPFWFFFMDIYSKIEGMDEYMMWMLLFNGIIFYLQSLFAYLLMSLISPVTFSVSNTVKRACLIWFSVLVFGNQITAMSGLGTCLVVMGVFLYQRARHVESASRERAMQLAAKKHTNI